MMTGYDDFNTLFKDIKSTDDVNLLAVKIYPKNGDHFTDLARTEFVDILNAILTLHKKVEFKFFINCCRKFKPISSVQDRTNQKLLEPFKNINLTNN